MFQSFTGSSRRPRQVNMSGRSNNPFTAHAALASAQQEREKRQRERDKHLASVAIQRSWRGYSSRMVLKQRWREEWDATESGSFDQPSMESSQSLAPYGSDAEALQQLKHLLRFVDIRREEDAQRLRHHLNRQALGAQTRDNLDCDEQWSTAYLHLQKRILAALAPHLVLSKVGSPMGTFLLESLLLTINRIPDLTSGNAAGLYRVLARLTRSLAMESSPDQTLMSLLFKCVESPLQNITKHTLEAYEAFGCHFLTLINLTQPPLAPTWLDGLAKPVNYKLLASAINQVMASPDYHGHEEMQESRSRLGLLASLIYFHRYAHRYHSASADSSQQAYIHAISALLGSVTSEMTPPQAQKADDLDDEKDMFDAGLIPEDSFVQEQLLSLVNKESVSNLLSGASNSVSGGAGSAAMGEEAKQLASFALTLLRFFPQKGDDIRVWLYWGSQSDANSGEKIPAIKYFWQATKTTKTFESISQDAESAIRLLNPKRPTAVSNTLRSSQANNSVQDDWRVILLFFELYSFVLRMMDDEEFFSPQNIISKPGAVSTWASYNALPLGDVKDLTIFLKNLGFTMYFNAFEITNLEDRESKQTGSIGSYFGVPNSSNGATVEPEPKKSPEAFVAGLHGVSVDYVKGLVTGLLRMLYERDSRRQFLPQDHWLMTSRFNMEGFISAVVEEEEKRSKIQTEQDEDEGHPSDDDEEHQNSHIFGHSLVVRQRNLERLKRRQRRLSRKRKMQVIAPRLEILQNMPFFIPFATRVHIFREFVTRDKIKRRGPDHQFPFHFVFENQLDNHSRHQGRIRRDHVFDDAYRQFDGLNDGLKEPIQITFVDKFDNEEAGIDGGGVTKEFLTSVTKEAFTPSHGLQMFVENDKHLLYPNPSAVDELKKMMQQEGVPEKSEEWSKKIFELLKRYEFLGRIIGKCLYEGILVDVGFAGFFLLKWALTGGAGSAPKESGYRANLNDLRELDEELYQGLLQLKNYPGDVEDFSLNFTVTDTITTDYETGATQNVTRELMKGGADEAVTKENRLLYISHIARYRLQIRPFQQTSAFLRGLSAMIQPSWLNMFNQPELQTLIGGTSSSIDLEDMRRNTVYLGVYEIGDDKLEHPTMQCFWRVMESFTDDERKAVIKFVTSTPRAPLLGFETLNPKFSIRDSGNDESRLPSTSTCVNLLKLPIYRSDKVLKDKLLTAIFSGAGFDLS